MQGASKEPHDYPSSTHVKAGEEGRVRGTGPWTGHEAELSSRTAESLAREKSKIVNRPVHFRTPYSDPLSASVDVAAIFTPNSRQAKISSRECK